MITRQKHEELKHIAVQMLKKAGISITAKERETMEIVDFGLGMPENIGLQIIVYVNNLRYCAKELIMMPRQTCPEHKHPPVSVSNPGKQETFRCRYGEVYLYTPGPATPEPAAYIEKRKEFFTVWHQVLLKPGDQFTLAPDTLHWFQAGDLGAVLSEFSSVSIDKTDIFTDPRIQRAVEIRE